MRYLEEEKKRIKFGFLVCLFIVLPFLTYVFLTPRPKCLKTETRTTTETYYDFSESGMGIWQGPSTKTICTEWEPLPSK